MTCLRHFTDHVSEKESQQDPIQKCFQSLEFLAKFVVRSRVLFLRSSVGQTDNSFRDSVRLIFDSFNKMLSHSAESFQVQFWFQLLVTDIDDVHFLAGHTNGVPRQH